MKHHTENCYRPLAYALLTLGVSVLIVAWGSISLHFNNWWAWNEVVHEGGELTLLWTVFYFEHASRELPLDILLGVAVGSSVFFLCTPPADLSSPAKRPRHRLMLSALLSALVISAIVAGTLWENGSEALLNNLLQMHTRPGAELVWGAHWRYHLLSRLSLMLISLGFAALLVYLRDGKAGTGDRSGMNAFGLVLIAFAGISLVFLPDMDPLRDPVFLGHQIREVFTHALVTLPASWGVCLLHAAQSASAKPATADNRTGLFWPTLAGSAGIVLGIYILAGALLTSAASQGQTGDMTMLIFPHFFEHSFTFLVVPAVAVLSHELLVLRTHRRGQ